MSRAALYDQTGSPAVLRVADVTDPEPKAGEVLVRVRAAGLNPFDAKVLEGFIPSKEPFPRRIGSDLAGTVEAVGEGAVYWDGQPIRVGDEVLGSGPGAVAQRTVAAASMLTRRPDLVRPEVAAGLHVAGLTAVSCLVTVPLAADDVALVGGATGAVGLMVCQLAAQIGARVIGTAAEANHDFVRSLGAEPVAYGAGLAERVKALGDVTAVMDCHGREALDAGIELGVPVERMVAIAGYAAVDELGVHNVERSARTAENLAKLADGVAAGELVMPVADTFALDDVVAAFKALTAPHAPGKIVVVP